MKTVIQLNKWANSHNNVIIDTARIATGLFLIFKGFQFSFQSQYLEGIFASSSLGSNLFLEHYIAMSHIAGGFLIVVGLLTRWALIAQLPILIGAVLINFIGVMSFDNLVQSSLLLISAVFFVFYGSGKLSADYSLKMNA